MGSRSTGTRGMTSLTCEPSLHQAQRAYVHLMGAALGPHERVFVKGLASARSARCFSVRRRPSFENFVSPSRVFLAVSFGTFFSAYRSLGVACWIHTRQRGTCCLLIEFGYARS